MPDGGSRLCKLGNHPGVVARIPRMSLGYALKRSCRNSKSPVDGPYAVPVEISRNRSVRGFFGESLSDGIVLRPPPGSRVPASLIMSAVALNFSSMTCKTAGLLWHPPQGCGQSQIFYNYDRMLDCQDPASCGLQSSSFHVL